MPVQSQPNNASYFADFEKVFAGWVVLFFKDIVYTHTQKKESSSKDLFNKNILKLFIPPSKQVVCQQDLHWFKYDF